MKRSFLVLYYIILLALSVYALWFTDIGQKYYALLFVIDLILALLPIVIRRIKKNQ